MKKLTAPMQIAEELAAKIANRELHPNEHLVESAIAKEFNTSRAPVREALLMLEKDRLVTRVPHHGFVVKNFSKEEIHQLYDATFRLEEIALEKAMNNIVEEDLTRLEEILNKQKQAIEDEDIVSYYNHNEEFHTTLFSIAQNEFLKEMHQSLRRSSRPLSLLNMGQGNNLSLSFEEHCQQFNALKNKDKEIGLKAIRDQEKRSLKTLDIFYIN
ncbi:GntR family transcriptional regulator [Halalkalibacter oceani]|uniref:GntR family transcriptional regulator n=1 Tax=Halalkalibacter oceani TaxID=1653776 RepID=UPI003396BB7E